MTESGYYAPGTEYLPNAPWNEIEQPTIERSCFVRVDMFNPCVDVATQDYFRYSDGDYDTHDVDWAEEYAYHNLSVLDLLGELRKMAINELSQQPNVRRARHLREIIKACEGWEIDEVEVEEN